VSSERAKSIIEIGALRPPAEECDVVILGGGLAGLTLSIQLKLERPETNVVVLEKREGPAPLAAFKVGESTVPCGAHYFAEAVGMKEHLEKEQNIKCGLRYFVTTEDNKDITKRLEFGPDRFPPHDNYQVDRGLFENRLAQRARAVGVELASGARVGQVTLGTGGERHTVEFEQFGTPSTTSARWVVDASGRSSILKRKLGLGTDCGHHINSSWFRLANGLDLEDWGRDDPAWMARMSEPGIRQFSTNHLMGKGYWVWLIPLATGPISIGVCADPRIHPFEEISQFDRLLEWLEVHEPQLAASVAGRLDDVEDFLRVEDFAYGVEQTYFADRYSLVGEAGAFADPFYSPGSDFIGIGNTFTADLIRRDLGGEDIAERLDYYNHLYQRTFAHVIARYRDSYPIFGNPRVAAGLEGWDFYANHCGIVLLFVKNKITDLEFMRSVDEDLSRLFELNIRTHAMFVQWNELEQAYVPPGWPRLFHPLIAGLIGLVKPYPDDDAIRAELKAEIANSEAMAIALFAKAAAALPEPPPTNRPINPYAISLDPDRWEADGLFTDEGMTIDQARAVTNGIDGLWDPSVVPPGPPPGFGPPPGVGGPGGPLPGMGGPPGVGPGGPPPGMGEPPPGMGGPGGPPVGVGE
jgi:flavin-dependent dehydrogenase